MAKLVIGRAGEVPEGEARRFVVGGQEVAVANLGGGEFRAVGDVCSHAEAHLHEGDVDPDLETIECPRHGSSFDLATGEPRSLPATMPVPTYEIIVEDDELKVEI